MQGGSLFAPSLFASCTPPEAGSGRPLPTIPCHIGHPGPASVTCRLVDPRRASKSPANTSSPSPTPVVTSALLGGAGFLSKPSDPRPPESGGGPATLGCPQPCTPPSHLPLRKKHTFFIPGHPPAALHHHPPAPRTSDTALSGQPCFRSAEESEGTGRELPPAPSTRDLFPERFLLSTLLFVISRVLEGLFCFALFLRVCLFVCIGNREGHLQCFCSMKFADLLDSCCECGPGPREEGVFSIVRRRA